MSKVIDVQAWRVVNRHTGSAMEIMASDVASSYGLLIDFAVCDEVTIWPKRDLFDSILSAAAKRANCLLLCIGNAGFQDSWQWSLRESVRNDPAWYFSRLEGAVASWISEANLAEQRRLLPPSAFDRLWLNLWSSAGGDALDEAIIKAAFDPGLRPLAGALPGYEFVAGVDAGVSRDASAVCVLGVRRQHEGHGRIRLAHTRLWRPRKGQKVNLQEVEDALLDLHDRFDFRQVNYDPWEMRHLASRLQAAGLGRVAGEPRFGRQRRKRVPMVEVTPSGKNLQAMATAVIEAFNDRRLELYEDADLRRDLTRMRVVEKSYGFRIESSRDETGHGDLGTAFSLAMLAASELAAKRKIVAGGMGNAAAPGASPMERHLARVQRQAEGIQRERERLAGMSDRDFQLRKIMRELGGAKRLGF